MVHSSGQLNEIEARGRRTKAMENKSATYYFCSLERRIAKNACDVKIAVELKGRSQRDDDEEGKQKSFSSSVSPLYRFFVVFAERKIRSNEKSEHCISHALHI